MTKNNKSLDLVSVVSLTVFCVVLLLFSFGQLSYNDFWWHIAAGKWMFATHSFLTREIFSFAFQGKEWLNGTWLYDGIVYLTYSAASFWGLSILRFAIFALTYLFFIMASRIRYKTPLIVAVSVFLLTFNQIRNFLRPEITQPLFVGIFLYALYKYKYSKSKIIFLLPLVEVIWVNAHGSFLMGITLIGIFFASELMRSLIRHRKNMLSVLKENKALVTYFVVLLFTVGASLINPIGYRIYILISAIFKDQESLKSISEWQSYSLVNVVNFSSVWLLPFAFLACSSIAILSVRIIKFVKKQRKLIPFLENLFYEDILLLLYFMYAMTQYTRLTSMFSIIAAFIVVKNYRVVSEKFNAHAVYAGLFLMPVALFIFFSVNKINLKLNTGPDDFSQAKESIAFIKDNKLPGHILNEYADGGELIWQLYPRYQIFIDGRTPNVYDNDFYWYYRNIGKDTILDTVSDKYALSFAVAPMGSGLADKLSQSKKWTLVFFDNYEYVFLRNEVNDVKFIDKNKYTVLNPHFDDTHYIEICKNKKTKDDLIAELDRNMAALEKPLYSMTILSTILRECPGRTQQDLLKSEALLKQAISYKAYDQSLYNKLGTTQIALDKNKEAVDVFKKAITLAKSRSNMTGLGIALHNLGDYKGAEKIFKQVPFVPGDVPDEYYQIYGRVSYQLDDNARAIELFHHYDDLVGPEKVTAQDYLDLSNAYKDDGRLDQEKKYADMAKNFKVPTSTKDLVK